MDEQEYKRLRRLVLRCFFVSLLLIVIAVFAISYKLKELNTQFASYKPQIIKQTTVERFSTLPPIEGLNGLNGSPGVPGANGSNGTNGIDGQNITPDQIAAAVSAYLEANPPSTGAQGQPGTPGRTAFVRNDPITGVLECQYFGDLAWQPLSECQ